MNKSRTQRAKRAKLTQSTAPPLIRKTVFLFIIFIAQSSFLNYHSLPVGKYSTWQTCEWTGRPHASPDGLHLSLLLLSLWEVKPTKPTDSVTLSCYTEKQLWNSHFELTLVKLMNLFSVRVIWFVMTTAVDRLLSIKTPALKAPPALGYTC